MTQDNVVDMSGSPNGTINQFDKLGETLYYNPSNSSFLEFLGDYKNIEEYNFEERPLKKWFITEASKDWIKLEMICKNQEDARKYCKNVLFPKFK